MSEEVWKSVLGFVGRYEVSDKGRIRSVSRLAPMPRNGSGATKRVRGKVLATKAGKDGYVRLSLKDDTGKAKLRYLHRLVLESFVGPCPSDMEGCHDNGNRSDNRLVNLRWDTRLANNEDKIKHGTVARGENNKGGGKLTQSQAFEIRTRLSLGESGVALAKEFAVSNALISKIKRKELWVANWESVTRDENPAC